ncbi:hypothetical protein QYM36_010487 [Artemia franciscana]|uniref:Uncharacterized protein n=2 Tax=Artemia franciscana TaxID=6661 RepID=A0AA88HQ72_ARTSF|nr:hypothetical protein QYM36_010487 [Artemia franciscana]
MEEVLEITLKLVYGTLAQNELLHKSVESAVIDILVLLATKELTLFASLTEGLERTKFENLKFNDFILKALKKLQIEELSEAT